jgi:hypothetical protein
MLENPPIYNTSSAPKVEKYYLQSLTYLTRVSIKYNSSHDFAVYNYISTLPIKLCTPSRPYFSIYYENLPGFLHDLGSNSERDSIYAMGRKIKFRFSREINH